MKTIAILGNNYDETTSFVNKIIENTNAKIDQEHLKMNIIIDNKLEEKTNSDLEDILIKLLKIDSSYLVLTINNERITNFFKKQTNLPLLNDEFNLDNQDLIKQIIQLGKEL